jgi:hypothetical protein
MVPIKRDANTAVVPMSHGEQVLHAFRLHFQREPDLHNSHDRACLRMFGTFIERYGRLPDTSDKGDLKTIQLIEVSLGAQDPVSPAVAEALAQIACQNDYMNQVEMAMRSKPQVDCPLVHRCVPGMYAREIFHPKDVLTTTKVWKKEHLFIISRGACLVSHGDAQWFLREAPYTGVTVPGTRRMIYASADMVLTTLHPSDQPMTDGEEPAWFQDEWLYEHDPADWCEGPGPGVLEMVGAA